MLTRLNQHCTAHTKYICDVHNSFWVAIEGHIRSWHWPSSRSVIWKLKKIRRWSPRGCEWDKRLSHRLRRLLKSALKTPNIRKFKSVHPMVLQFQTHFQFSCVVQLWFNRMKVTVTKRGSQGSSCYFSFGSKCLLSPRNRPIGLLHPIHCMIPFIKIDFPNTALVGLKLHPVISLASRDCRRLFSFSKAPFPWPRATWPPWFPVPSSSNNQLPDIAVIHVFSS